MQYRQNVTNPGFSEELAKKIGTIRFEDISKDQVQSWICHKSYCKTKKKSILYGIYIASITIVAETYKICNAFISYYNYNYCPHFINVK